MAQDKGIIEACVRRDADVRRTLDHESWRDAARAAIAYYVHGIESTNAGWKKSKTWKYVEDAYKRCSGSS